MTSWSLQHYNAQVLATSSNPRLFEDEMKWRHWMFGDCQASTHRFLEHALFRAPKEIACAAAASLMVSPIVSIIDKCIVQDISGTRQFFSAIAGASREIVMAPRQFFGGRPFRLTVAVYFGTYAVANLSELVLDINRIREEEQRKQIKVTASSVTNISLLAWRDSVFARTLSSSSPKHSMPVRSLGLFAVRDASTMYATFYVAPSVAEYMQDELELDGTTAELGSALGMPVLSQLLTAPFHIHAMDCYNRPKATVAQRFATIMSEFSTVAFARGFRILPAFGIGSFSNNRLREYMIRHDYDPELPANSLQRRITTTFGLEEPRTGLLATSVKP